MELQEKKEHLAMIRQALDLIDNRAFEVLNDVEIEASRGWVKQFRDAHDNLGELISLLAGLAGVEEEDV
jgi:hypothetical protein